MADIVKFPGTKKETEREFPKDKPKDKVARDHTQALNVSMDSEAQDIARKLRAVSRVPPAARKQFAKAMFRIFAELEQKGAATLVGTVLACVQGGGMSTKRRGRFAQASHAKTPLAASPDQWLRVAQEAGQHLRGESWAVIEMVAGTEFAARSHPWICPRTCRMTRRRLPAF